jgi:hypothetical protein
MEIRTERDPRVSPSAPHLSDFWCVLLSPQERVMITRLLKINQAVLTGELAVSARIMAEEPVTDAAVALEKALTRSALRKLTPP